MSVYTPTIGLEVHAELKTRTKMFCDSKNDPDEKRPNVNICPVCMGHPGALPVINKEAVKHVLKIGVAVGGQLSSVAEFDRKNYFYPDLPKGYQISQWKRPLVKGGELAGVVIHRVHLEEDTARSIHEGNRSLIDFNRAGIPLMELVTEPVIKDAKTAGRFAKELQLLLRSLGAGEANMEKGEMRVEANISISGSGTLGTKVEVKNLNSFRSVERAIAYEVKRQNDVLERGERVVQETRGWDEKRGETVSQRLKEESHDYRYFPDPDLPLVSLNTPEFSPEALRDELPELPWERRTRYIRDYGVKPEDAEMYVANQPLRKFFEEAAKILNLDAKKVQLASNYLTSDVAGLMRWDDDRPEVRPEQFGMSPDQFAELIEMVADAEITSRTAKDILVLMVGSGGSPRKIVQEHGLLQKSDENELMKIVDKVFSLNEKAVSEYRAGKKTALEHLVGQGMKETRGSANPNVLRELFLKKL